MNSAHAGPLDQPNLPAGEDQRLRYLVLTGPTASGKTDLSVALAEELRTEIVVCDAFQLYQGFDLLSAKPTREELARVRHHLVGVLPVEATCDAYRYAAMARSVISELNEKGTIPLVVGGNGFYLQALTQGLPSLPGACAELRQQWRAQPLCTLLSELRARDPLSYERIDRANRRRVERALEVCVLSGRPFSDFGVPAGAQPAFPGLAMMPATREELHARIEARARRMLAEGAIEEVSSASEIGPTASQMIGIAAIRTYLEGKISLPECQATIVRQTRNYAKRQLTWIRKRRFQTVPIKEPFREALAYFRDAVCAAKKESPLR